MIKNPIRTASWLDNSSTKENKITKCAITLRYSSKYKSACYPENTKLKYKRSNQPQELKQAHLSQPIAI